MIQFDTYAQVEAWLDARPQFKTDGAKATDLRPAKMLDFCARLGHPERRFASIHVAGTNGKGTTCSMLASMYAEAGFKTGLYTSPHVESWRERIKLNGSPADEGLILSAFRKMGWAEGFEKLTYFELSTVAAFWVFAEAGVDLAILETGMGGRLDATNIVEPVACVITSIGLDHTEFLGPDLPSIAREKAGIIKAGIPVVIGDFAEAAKQVVYEVAGLLNSPVVEATALEPVWDVASGSACFEWGGGRKAFPCDVSSTTSAMNAAMAASVVALLQDRYPVSDHAMQDGLRFAARNTGLRGRMERLQPALRWYYDGAHNAQALEVLAANLRTIAPLQEWNAVFAMMGDKATPEVAEAFSKFKKRLYWKGGGARSASEDLIRERFGEVVAFSDDEILGHLEGLSKEFVIFTGSFYFYNEVRRWIRMISVQPD